jgi:predicted N-acetyltransferase YhbS
MVAVRTANESDAVKLTEIQSRTFQDDNRRKPKGVSQVGPPGYDSVEWNRQMIRDTHYFVIEDTGRMVGGIIVFAIDVTHYDVGRIFVEPRFQNYGIGKQAMRLVFRELPQEALWTVGTPEWAYSNHRFYQRIGFRKVRETEVDPDLGWAGFEYEKGPTHTGSSFRGKSEIRNISGRG